MRFVIRGTVQGVGFRPTVYRVAKAMASIPVQDREIMARSLRTLLKSLYEQD